MLIEGNWLMSRLRIALNWISVKCDYSGCMRSFSQNYFCMKIILLNWDNFVYVYIAIVVGLFFIFFYFVFNLVLRFNLLIILVRAGIFLSLIPIAHVQYGTSCKHYSGQSKIPLLWCVYCAYNFNYVVN